MKEELLLERELVLTLDAVEVTKIHTCGVTTYEIRHACFKCPGNPHGIYVNNDLDMVDLYARRIAQEGSAFA
jgi:hypothetical protein